MHTVSNEATGFAVPTVNSVVSPAQVLADVVRYYPSAMLKEQLEDLDRIAYHLKLIQRFVKPEARVCDIGGGVGLFSPGCAALGYDTTLVDDFQDDVNLHNGEGAFAPHKKYGVKVVCCDVIGGSLDFPANSFDIITTFDSMEHWHHSPKRLFHMLKKALAPNGIFIIGVPNCNNLRKRIITLLGKGHWSVINDWYEPDVFRAHVREPSVGDLKYICKDLNMVNLGIVGKNWQGRKSYPLLTRLADRILQIRPGLCSDLYVIAGKRLN